ncbi:MAG: RecX family transcriptional regulator [Alloprevotella sp.]|nr:RecX family transcriptional regulator [Alloprevotella sp.]
MKELTAESLYAWAAGRCSRSEYCRNEMERKMREKGADAALARTTVQRLVDEGYVDDARFARAFVHDRTLYERWGRQKTRQALLMRGLNSSDIDNALHTIDEEQYVQTLRTLLEAKARTLRAESPYLLRQKLLRFATSRGFETHLVMENLPSSEDD